jgi:hypothetical protein
MSTHTPGPWASYIVRDEKILARAIAMIRGNWQAMAASAHPMVVHLSTEAATRSQDQSAEIERLHTELDQDRECLRAAMEMKRHQQARAEAAESALREQQGKIVAQAASLVAWADNETGIPDVDAWIEDATALLRRLAIAAEQPAASEIPK